MSLQGELGAYMEETVRRVTPRTSLGLVLRQQAVIEGVEAQNFFKSQSLGGSLGVEFFRVPRSI